MAVLVLLRHGESDWNAADVFAGWIDVALSEHGKHQAERSGALLAARGFLPDVVHTSVQRRAVVTADLALAACGRSWIPVRRSWRLNSNHYGALQGRGKAEVRAEAGEEQFTAWRRGFRVRPPLVLPVPGRAGHPAAGMFMIPLCHVCGGPRGRTRRVRPRAPTARPAGPRRPRRREGAGRA